MKLFLRCWYCFRLRRRRSCRPLVLCLATKEADSKRHDLWPFLEVPDNIPSTDLLILASSIVGVRGFPRRSLGSATGVIACVSFMRLPTKSHRVHGSPYRSLGLADLPNYTDRLSSLEVIAKMELSWSTRHGCPFWQKPCIRPLCSMMILVRR